MSYSSLVPLSPRPGDGQGGFIPSMSSPETWVPHTDNREAGSSLGLCSHIMLSSGVPPPARSSQEFSTPC